MQPPVECEGSTHMKQHSSTHISVPVIIFARRNADGVLETSGCDAPQFLLVDYEAAR